MKLREFFGTSLLCAALILGCSAVNFANDSNTHSRTVDLSHSVVLAGTSLSAGRYTINWQTHSPEAAVQFVKHHAVLASAEGRIEQREKKYNRNAVVYNVSPDGAMSVAEIRFAGSKEVLVFNQ